MSQYISMRGVVPRLPDNPFTLPLDWQINQNETWGIVGPNGSGKSLITELVCGKIAVHSGHIHYHFLEEPQAKAQPVYPAQRIKKIEFNAAYSLYDYRKLFYQQRFNHSENEAIPPVRELLPPETISKENLPIFHAFKLMELMDRKIIHLSSGELRKFLIAKMLLDNPQVLIFDNPFIGLDEESRHQLNEMFVYLRTRRNIHLMFVTPSLQDLPACTTHILEMKDCTIRYSGPKSGFSSDVHPTLDVGSTPGKHHTGNRSNHTLPHTINWRDYSLPHSESESDEIVSMTNLDIAYGERVIQKNINWIIRKNEKWALLGPNGSGKSTLLSYIYADNPQAYAKNIHLFGRKRGTGESIWDIKRRIGFSSSELHLYYRDNATCLSVVASGFFDNIGMYRRCNEQQLAMAASLLETLRIGHLKEKSFLKISSGEQRLLFFARAIIKNPALLILDEPFHGLDAHNKALCKAIVESYAAQPGKTLIYVTHRKEEIPACVDHHKQL